MKKLIMAAGIIAISTLAFSSSSFAAEKKQVLARIAKIEVYKGDINKSYPDSTLTDMTVASFKHCAVYLPEGKDSAQTVIKLTRKSDGSLTISCGEPSAPKQG
ncbi:hypothetical protein [Dongshaea marina]|uniref:hypothetical protein n=1 Tax=Dongshaea marina TaxID=2047966 RepID=UPI000D3EC918|nr:hypothetical protein [Dongshaea marina]